MHIPDLTIVIPVHGRQWTLNRSLAYLTGFDGPVIVADSSPAPAPNIGKFPRVDYRHMPGVGYYEKLRTVYASVTTPFLVDIPDDDFPVLSGVSACCAHLRAHPDVAICGGHILVFKGSPEGVALELIHSGANLAHHARATRELQATETLHQHLVRLFAYPLEIVHAVMRKGAALAPHELLARQPNLRPIRFFSRLWLFSGLIAGRFAHLDEVFILRAKDERLINAANYPAELERGVKPEELPARLGEGGGVLTTYLMNRTGMARDEAQKIVADVLHYITHPMSAAAFERAREATLPLAEAAIARQATDINRIIGLVRAYPGPG